MLYTLNLQSNVYLLFLNKTEKTRKTFFLHFISMNEKTEAQRSKYLDQDHVYSKQRSPIKSWDT